MATTSNPLAQLLAEALFDGAYRAIGYILGPNQLKAFVRSFGEVSLDKVLSKTGKTLNAQDPVAAAISWAKVESDIGLHGGQHTETNPTSEGVEVTYTDCVFAESCGAILADIIMQGAINKEELPCMRCSLTSAAITKASGTKTKYKMLQHAPGFRCRCTIHKI